MVYDTIEALEHCVRQTGIDEPTVREILRWRDGHMVLSGIVAEKDWDCFIQMETERCEEELISVVDEERRRNSELICAPIDGMCCMSPSLQAEYVWRKTAIPIESIARVFIADAELQAEIGIIDAAGLEYERDYIESWLGEDHKYLAEAWDGTSNASVEAARLGGEAMLAEDFATSESSQGEERGTPAARGDLPASLSVAEEFVESLTGDKGSEITTLCFDDSTKKDRSLTREASGTLQNLFPRLVRLNRRGAGVFLAVNKTDGAGRKKKNIVRVLAVWVDYDGEGVPASPLRPTIIVKSGNGYHFYFVLTEEISASECEEMNRRIADSMGGDRKATDVARVMRCPGFMHQKDPCNPRPVVLEDASGPRYSLAQLKMAFPASESCGSEETTAPPIERYGLDTPQYAAARAHVAGQPPAVSGTGGDDQTFKVVLDVVRGCEISSAAALELLERDYNPRCIPPWTRPELKHKIECAEKEDPRSPPWGYLLHKSMSGDREARGGKPSIQVNNRQLPLVARDAWNVIQRMEKEDPVLFSSGSAAIRLDPSPDGRNTLERMPFDNEAMFCLLVDCADWMRVTKNGETAARPDHDLIKYLMAYVRGRLPELRSLVRIPVFASDGTLVQEPGFNAQYGIYLDPEPGLVIPPIPEKPTRTEVESARSLVEEVFADFPFASPASKAHAWAYTLLPFVHALIAGPTPIHLVDATTAGTGKGLFAQAAGRIFVGWPLEIVTLSTCEEETSKRITALLISGQPVIIIDNVVEVTSGQLCAAITSEYWQGRQLGQSKMLTLPNRSIWVMTGNNVRLLLDVARRCIRIRFEPDMDRPWQRDSFRHDPLLAWVDQERGNLVHALLTIVQGWIVAGRPAGGVTLGSFEGWARVIGGILEFAGIPGFLTDLNDLYEHADDDSAETREFCEVWWSQYGERWIAARELVEVAETNGLLEDTLFGRADMGQRTAIAQKVRGWRDRVIDGRRIEIQTDAHRKTRKYRLRAAEKTAEASTEPVEAVADDDCSEEAKSPDSPVHSPTAPSASAQKDSDYESLEDEIRKAILGG